MTNLIQQINDMAARMEHVARLMQQNDMPEVVEHGQELARAANKARGWAIGIAEEQE